MNSLLSYIPAWAWPYIDVLTLQQWWYLANVTIILAVALGASFTYYSFRRGLGYQKFKGHWYSHESFEKLKEELCSGIRDGRLPDSETMSMLDKHVYGMKSNLRAVSGKNWI